MANRKKNGSNGNGSLNGQAQPEVAEDPALATLELATETLTGDIRDFILDRLRHEQDKRPWHERSEAEQRDTVHRVETAVHAAVEKAVQLIAAEGRKALKATIEQVTVKDGIKAILTMSKFDELRHNLIDAQGKTVLIVVSDTEEFEGERKPVAIKPDQGDLEAAMVEHSSADEAAEVPFH